MRKAHPADTAPGKLFLVKPRQHMRAATLTSQALEIAARIPFEQFASDVGDAAWPCYRSIIERLDNGSMSLNDGHSELDPDEVVVCLLFDAIRITAEIRDDLVWSHAREVVKRWTANAGPKKLPAKLHRSMGGER